MTEEAIREILLKKDFIEFPKELDRTGTVDELHKMMTAHNSDIPIDKVTFQSYPGNNLE